MIRTIITIKRMEAVVVVGEDVLQAGGGLEVEEVGCVVDAVDIEVVTGVVVEEEDTTLTIDLFQIWEIRSTGDCVREGKTVFSRSKYT
mmetsp:Transcript_3960/g.4568  ORF Transcript_3960/g.4568 Transcript_3960/m.4568 type:complete len:88 (-) Transcript_3960:230-493(-)